MDPMAKYQREEGDGAVPLSSFVLFVVVMVGLSVCVCLFD